MEKWDFFRVFYFFTIDSQAADLKQRNGPLGIGLKIVAFLFISWSISDAFLAKQEAVNSLRISGGKTRNTSNCRCSTSASSSTTASVVTCQTEEDEEENNSISQDEYEAETEEQQNGDANEKEEEEEETTLASSPVETEKTYVLRKVGEKTPPGTLKKSKDRPTSSCKSWCEQYSQTFLARTIDTPLPDPGPYSEDLDETET